MYPQTTTCSSLPVPMELGVKGSQVQILSARPKQAASDLRKRRSEAVSGFEPEDPIPHLFR